MSRPMGPGHVITYICYLESHLVAKFHLELWQFHECRLRVNPRDNRAGSNMVFMAMLEVKDTIQLFRDFGQRIWDTYDYAI